MSQDMKEKVRPFYSEFYGYLTQVPEESIPEAIIDTYVYKHYDDVLKLLEEATDSDYSRFMCKIDSQGYVRHHRFRNALAGLIARLHAEYFQDEPPPFRDMPPTTTITVSQQQSQTQQMVLDVDRLISQKLSEGPEGKERGFLEKLQGALGGVTSTAQLLRLIFETAKNFELSTETVSRLFSL